MIVITAMAGDRRMKKFLLLPMIMTALVLPGFAQPQDKQHPQTETVQAPPEPKFIDEILNSYQSGEYDSFLQSVHEKYQDATDKWEYNHLLEERKKLSSVVQDFDADKTSEFKKKMTALHEAENRELVELCLSEPNCPLTREVKEMIFFTPSQHEQESLDYLATLNWKFKGDGKTLLENKLIAIDTEFWLKTLALDVLATQNQLDEMTYLKKRAVLQLEKLKQMELAVQGQDVDPKIKGYITTAKKIYPQVQASSITRKFLHDLATNRVQPANATQEKMKEVVTKYHDKQQKLASEYFPEEQK